MNVVDFTGVTTASVPVDQVLDAAKESVTAAVVVGVDADGELYVASSLPRINGAIVLLERAKLQLLRKFEDGY